MKSREVAFSKSRHVRFKEQKSSMELVLRPSSTSHLGSKTFSF